ncbi:MAG: KEOPS complex subunit Pcc1 [Candidatus Nitrosocosmicus sp.]|uniref:KEOPS complex subunit Pcc1 n=1 Tax=Candidatus Nitrosocosmicus sp. FF01 TaxID=3397670 RepID=UPI0039EBD991
MENYNSRIHIYFDIKPNPDFFKDPTNLLTQQLNSIFVALKGDIQSTPDFGAQVTVSTENNCIVVSISSNNVSKFRATIVSLLRLIDLSYSVIQIDKQ